MNAYYRNAKLFEQNSKPAGQRRCAAVKRIARLRIHKYAYIFLVQGIVYIADKGNVADKFLRRNTADLPHKPLLADKPVRGAHNAVRLWKHNF